MRVKQSKADILLVPLCAPCYVGVSPDQIIFYVGSWSTFTWPNLELILPNEHYLKVDEVCGLPRHQVKVRLFYD